MSEFGKYGVQAAVRDGELAIIAPHGKTLSPAAGREFTEWLMDEYGLTAQDKADADAVNNEAYQNGVGGAFTSSVPVEESTPASAAPAVEAEPFDVMEPQVGTPIAPRRRPGRPRKNA